MRRKLIHVLCLPLLSFLLGGCVHYTPATTDAGDTFDHLWARDLSAFEQRIATENHTGTDDEWTRVAEGWLAFTNCEDFSAPDDFTDPGARFALATLFAEDVRRRLEIVRASQRRRPIETDMLSVDVTRPKFFDRAASERDPDWIEWPIEQEGWADETPARVPVASGCEGFVRRVVETREDQDDPDSKRLDYYDWLDRYRAAVAASARAYQGLPAERQTANAAQVDWSSRLQAAYLASEAAQLWRSYAGKLKRRAERGADAERSLDEARAAKERAEVLRAEAVAGFDELLSEIPEEVAPESVANARLLAASARIEEGRPGAALELLAATRDTASDDNRWAGRYLELKIAADAARWSDAAKLADDLPPASSRLHGAYAYRAALSLRRTQQPDRFLNVAMKAFRDRPYEADPFLRALYWETLESLAEYPFDDRVVELLEEMGQRGGTFERVEEYARVALDRARPENADAAARWLLARHDDARYHPRYNGIIALAAFLDDDAERFREALTEVGKRPSAVVEVVPSNRQSTFFAEADTELARVLRQMLPVMVEWGDAASARDRRQRWLEIIVEYSQSFVRNTKDTLARPQLVELYRLASSLLEEHPRGYAERVGAEEPTPLILGTVRVSGRDLAAFEPALEVDLPTPYSLTLVPRERVPLSQWPMRWPAPKTDAGEDEP